MEDHVSREGFESSGRVRRGLAAVDDDRKAELVRQGQLRVEQPALLGGCRVALHVVEAGLAHRDRFRVLEQLAQFVEAARFGSRRLMRVDSERRVDALVLLCERERGATRVDPGADGDDPAHPRRCSSLDHGRRHLAGVEVRVRVGHAASRPSASSSIRFSSSATTFSGSSFVNSGCGSRSACPGGSALGSQRPAQSS